MNRQYFVLILPIALQACAPNFPMYPLSPHSPGKAPKIHGCINSPLKTCLAEISQYAVIRELRMPSNEVDIYGKPTNTDRNVTLTTGPLGAGTTYSLDLNKEDIVTSAIVHLPDTPGFPRFTSTEAEYDQSGVYPAAYQMYGTQCAEFNKMDFYKFIDTAIKPKLNYTHNYSSHWIRTVKDKTGEASVSYCNTKFTFKNFSGYDTNLLSEVNHTGVFNSNLIKIESQAEQQ